MLQRLNSDITQGAVYTPWVTLVRVNKLSIALAGGCHKKKRAVKASKQQKETSEVE